MKKTKKINVRKLKLAYTYRAMMLWEYITGRVFELNGSITDTFLFIWCVIETNNPGAIEIADLEDHCDNNEDDARYLNEWLSSEIKRRSMLRNDSDKKKVAKE